MKSLVTYMGSSAFNMVKGIKSLNLELTWRPYGSEQAVPTVEELVGDSELSFSLANISVGGEAKSQLAELLKWLGSLTQPVSIEEETQRKLQVFLKSLTDIDSVTVDPSPSDCELSNVLPTREERLRSMLRRTQLKRTYDHAGLWDGDGCTVQSQSPGRSKVDSPLEDDNHGQSTEPDSVDSDALVRGRALLSDPSEDEALDSQIDIVSASAPHGQLSMESIVSLSPACLSLRSPNSDSISSLEPSRGPAPDCIYLSKTGGLEGNHWPTSSGLATWEEQSLRGYLKVLAKQHPSGQADNDKRLTSTSPARSELRRCSPSPVDTEGLLRDLSKLAAPLPPLEASSRHNHRYLASVELLQDRPLMRVLRHDSFRMELLEREWVDGADIVFDCDTALVFASLFQVSLPSSFRSLKDRLSSLSWRYTDLAVIFKLDEASISGLQRPQDEEEGMDLSARVIKSIKKLQRELALAEAYAIKRPETVIQMFSPWGDRLWLGVDEKEEERYLAGVDGMNAFAAAAILGQISLHDFLALRADQRLQLLLPIPASMMEQFNAVIIQRREDVDTLVEDEGGAY
ncbi:hypothetical protein F5888DRAFT_1688664 [Russula emetica]|nr:hypothetical protein F5888DRAFT_1688664 [Russula emetica]